jgi:hypothetical protein
MSSQNFYLKQISCLESPVNNQGWHEIVHHCPAALHCLVQVDPVSQQQNPAVDENDIDPGQPINEALFDEPIPWCDVMTDDGDVDIIKPFQLESFVYDCSYLSPFVGNVYSREQSVKGWYRWVGPDPRLVVRIPLAPAKAENWLFTATFHAFLDDAHAQSLGFEVNGKSKPLEWLEGSAYQCRISTADLYCNAKEGDVAVVSLSISVPEARQSSQEDQRLLAFAIRELTLVPA